MPVKYDEIEIGNHVLLADDIGVWDIYRVLHKTFSVLPDGVLLTVDNGLRDYYPYPKKLIRHPTGNNCHGSDVVCAMRTESDRQRIEQYMSDLAVRLQEARERFHVGVMLIRE